MRAPAVVRRISIPLIIILFATAYILFSTNMGEWVQTHGSGPIARILETR